MPLDVFWPGLGLPRPKAIVVIPKINSSQNYLREKRVKVRGTPGHYAIKKRSVEISMHLGLGNIIKVKVNSCPIDDLFLLIFFYPFLCNI